MMGRLLKVLIPLAILEALTAAPVVYSMRDVTQAISTIIVEYNRFSEGKYRHRLVHTEHREADSAGGVEANFTIKETVCLKSPQNEDWNCDFKPGGVTVFCVARLTTAENIKRISAQCHPKNNTKRVFRRDLMAAVQGSTSVSGDTEKIHKQECLECIFTLLPTSRI